MKFQIIRPHENKDGYNDIITLVKFFRDAICHSEAYPKRTNKAGQYLSYVFQTGSTSDFMGYPHLCKYDDDIACIFGQHFIYINRHIFRLYKQFADEVFKLPLYIQYKFFIDKPKLDLNQNK